MQCILNHFVQPDCWPALETQHPVQKHSELNLKNDSEPAKKTIVFTASPYEHFNINCFNETHLKTLMGSVLSVTIKKLKPSFKFSQTKGLLFENHCQSLQTNDATAKYVSGSECCQTCVANSWMEKLIQGGLVETMLQSMCFLRQVLRQKNSNAKNINEIHN